MSITKFLASQSTIAKRDLHETLNPNRSQAILPFSPISGFRINKQHVNPLTTTTTRRNSMIVYATGEPATTPPPPSGSSGSSGSWKNWVMGILMTFIIPLVTTKGGPIKLLLQKVDQIMDTAEHISDVVEAVADKVDKVVEELEDDLPEGSQLKKTLDFIEHVAEIVEKDAHTAGDFIDKVQEMEDKLEDIIEPVLEEAKEVAKKEKAKKSNI